GEARSRDRRLPRQAALDRVVRYEAHVSRQLNQARQMLREVQAERRAREQAARTVAPVPQAAPGRTATTTEGHAAAGAPGAPAVPGSFGSRDGAPPRAAGGRPAGSPLPVVENQFVRSFVDVQPDKGLNGHVNRSGQEDAGGTDS